MNNPERRWSEPVEDPNNLDIREAKAPNDVLAEAEKTNNPSPRNEKDPAAKRVAKEMEELI